MNKLQAFLKRPHDFLTTAFMWIIVIFLLGYFVQTIINSTAACKYQEQIVQNQAEYLSLQAKKYDAIRTLGKHWKDSTQLSQSLRVLNAELKQDSIAWKSGAEAMMKDTQMLLDLHMNNIDRQYSVLTLWSAVMMILFLIFSFYAIFKLEDTLRQSKQMVHDFKGEVRRMMKNIRQEAKAETLKIIQEAETKNKELQAEAGIIIEDLKEKSEQHLQSLEERADKLIESLNDIGKAETVEITKEANRQQEVIQLLSEGLKADGNKEYQTAIEKYQQAIKIDPNNATIYNNWGNALSDWGELNNNKILIEESLSKYEKAIELKPDYAAVFYNWGSTLYDLARLQKDPALFEQSCQKYEKATKLDPDDAAIYNNWGNALAEWAKMDNNKELSNQSIQKYKKAIKLQPNFAEAYSNWGIALRNIARLTGSADLYKQSFSKHEKAIEIDPNKAIFYNNYACAYLEFVRLDNTYNIYKKEIEELLIKAESIQEGEGSYNLACLYSCLKETEKAFEWIEKGLKINNRNNTRDQYEKDEDFDNIKSDPRFKELLDRYYPEKKKPDEEK